MKEQNLSRRSFLKGAAAMSAAAAGLMAGIQPVQAKAESIYTPGTYTASAPGFGGEVVVTITVDETAILSASVEAAGETVGIGSVAAEKLAEEIMAKQSHQLDAVSGATRTSEAVKKACESCIAQAKGIDVSLLQAEAPAKEEAPKDWLGEEPEVGDVTATIDTEVLVIGAGTAGVFAACAAVEEGAKTILIEKFDEAYGGAGIRDTLAAIGSREQIESGKNPDKFDVITEMYRQSNGYGDQRLYKLWADHSGEAIDWYTDRMKEAGLSVRFEEDDHSKAVRYPIYDVGHSLQMSATQGEHGVSANILKEYGKAKGLEVRYEPTLVKLIKEEGKVTGIYANTKNGMVRYNASKGVIVCTGGYSLNMDMMNALQPETVKMININYSYPGSMGDGIKACLWAGAAMDETHAGMLFDRGAVMPNQVGPTPTGVLF